MSRINPDELKKTWGRHPARILTFDELHAGLSAGVREGNIRQITHGSLALYNYTHAMQFSNAWDLFALISRGLILDLEQQRVIATPFPKFFNHGEALIWGADTHQGEIVAANKYDGSLGIVYHHNDSWHVATRGAFHSTQAQWGREWLIQNITCEHLEPGHTYLFEIIFHGSKVVVNYDFEGLVLLGAYDHEGHEYSRSELETYAKRLEVRIAEVCAFNSVDDLVSSAETLGSQSEGWVLRFANGHRLKIKGQEYCRIHRVMSNVSPLGIWNLLLAGDNLDAVCLELPEEHRSDFRQIREILERQFQSLIAEVKAIVERTKALTDKELGLLLQSGQFEDGTSISDVQKSFAFAARKNNFLTLVHHPGDRLREKAFRYFRPTGNALDGYTPSSIISRFMQEG